MSDDGDYDDNRDRVLKALCKQAENTHLLNTQHSTETLSSSKERRTGVVLTSDQDEFERAGVTHLIHAWHMKGHENTNVIFYFLSLHIENY